MLYAKDIVSMDYVMATPKLVAECPHCNDQVISRCGQINAWHWAHRAESECPGSEGETEWHIQWKKQFERRFCEKMIIKDGVKKIADVQNSSGLVIEFQHSSISVDEIQMRESFYENMIWVFDVRDAYDNKRLEIFLQEGSNDTYYHTFRWKHAKRSILFCTKPVYLDLGFGLMFRVKKMYEGKVAGWGHCGNWDVFIDRLNV